MQVTIGTKDGETFQTEIEDASRLVGKTLGEEFEGGVIGLEGYTLEITGGSDRDGFPMRESIDGSARRRVLIMEGAGIEEDEDGVRRRKSVRGDTVSEDIQQLNTQVAEEGSKSVEELLGEED
ncbi:MAG: 30S ribosomal protein S6e [Candidatus Nanohaloarchaea archaeon]